MKKTIHIISLILLSNFLFGQSSKVSVINFVNNSFHLSIKNRDKLDSLIKEIKGNNNIKTIDIIGYTDNKGNYSTNLNLSKNRANEVKKYLTKFGVNNTLLLSKYLGSNLPISKNDNEVGKAKNRRVEIIVHYKTEKNKSLATVKSLNTFQCVNYNGLFKQLFKFNQNNEIKIVGKEGTKLVFNAGSFVDSLGNLITGEIEFTLYEVYRKSDMLISNLQTVSNNNLLETSGMFSINAFSKGKKAYLKSGVDYQIEIPSKNHDKKVMVFYGDTLKGNINWIQDTLKNEPQIIINDLNYRLYQKGGNYSLDYLDSNTNKIYNQFKASKLGWINCDRFVNVKNKTNLKVSVKESSINLFLVFSGINSIMNANFIDRTMFSNLPIGYQVSLIGLLQTNEGYFFGKKYITIEKDMEVNLTIDKYTEKEFDSFMEKLNQ